MIRSISTSAAALFALNLLGSPLHAQQPRPNAAPAPAASNPSPSANHLALARELASITGAAQVFDSVLPEFAAQIRRSAVTRPELTKDLEQVLEQLKPELEAKKQEMVTVAAGLYASRFTEAELKDIVGFFKTPAGQKYAQKTPEIVEAVADETTRWAKQMSQHVMTRVREEMGKRGHQL